MAITRDVMEQMEVLAESIAETIENYKNNSFCEENDKHHVLKWVSQFDEIDRLFVLEQTDLLLAKQYFTEDDFKEILDEAIKETDKKILRDYSFLDIQGDGDSQSDMLKILNDSCLANYGFPINVNDYTKNEFVYHDDVVFTGDRVCRDLEEWIKNSAPQKCSLIIAAIYTHSSAEYSIQTKLKKIISDSNKSIDLTLDYFGKCYENRFKMRNRSDVFWPKEENVNIPDDLDPSLFISTAPRGEAPGRTGFIKSYVFRNENDRDRYEKILCEKGFHIRSLSGNPKDSLKPLGYKTYKGLGFGGTIFTYRNCPNNTPLVFWWGNPNMDSWNPLSRWYPLMMRKPYKDV